MERKDKLGRRIPEFDRSAAIRKGNKTKKEKYGTDFHARSGAVGGRARSRGYFGKLKDEGKTDELRSLSAKGAEKTNKIKAEKRSGTKEDAKSKTDTVSRR